MQVKTLTADELDDPKNFQCWKCSNLIADVDNRQFFCKFGKILFEAHEPIYGKIICGTLKDEKRISLNGKTTYLYRLLVIQPKIIMHSLPEDLIGCVGNLQKYNLAEVTPTILPSRDRETNIFRKPEKSKIVTLTLEGQEK